MLFDSKKELFTFNRDIKRLYTCNLLNNNCRKFILKNNVFNTRFNTNNDLYYKFNFRKSIIYEF